MKNLVLIICVVLVFTALCTAENYERNFRTYKAFSSSIDQLLLDTAHVYIHVSHKTNAIYLANFGPLFSADISLTRSGSVPKIVEQWTQWFQKEEGDIVINKKDPECEKSEDKSKADELERIHGMEFRISEFKKEVMEVILDVGPVIRGTNPNDRLAIIFNVKEKAFFDKYKTNTLQVQIKMGTLTSLSGKSLDDESVKNAFSWNI